MNHTARVILVLVLLAAGVGLWWTIGARAGATPARVAAMGAALLVALIPFTRDRLDRWLERRRRPSVVRRRWTMLVVALASCAYVLATSLFTQGREMIPKLHDEHMHLLQIRMLAHGKLWTSPHPLADFFETFHVLTEPVYASIYFPGTALMYVPSVWLGLEFWVMPLLVAGACCAMIYRVVAELVDGEAGLLAALLLVSLTWFRRLALMVMSHGVMLLLGLAIVWAWLNWRRGRGLGWAAVIGALGGWAAITRPVDALCYSVPVGVAMLVALVRRRESLKRVAATIGVIVAAAAPFLALQVVQNVGITGNPFKTPYRLYADLYTPQMSFGFHAFDENVRPRTTLQQRQDYYDQFTVPAARAHRPERIVGIWLRERLPAVAKVTTPNRLLLILVPLGLLAAGRRRASVVLVCVLPVWVALYAAFSYLLDWYCIVVAPAVIACVAMAKEALADAVERSRQARAAVRGFVTLAIAALAIASLPELDRGVTDDAFVTPVMSFSYLVLPQEVAPPAIVLFRYRTGDSIHAEPVYNVDVVNPDDAPVIRAHDLGPERNRELFAYYAKRQPERTVYVFDRGPEPLVRLGNVAELARRFPVTRPGE